MQITSPLTTGAFYFYLDRVSNPATAGTALMRAVPGFGDGGDHEVNNTTVLSFSSGHYVCDEPTLVIPDLFGDGAMNTTKTVSLVRMSLARVAA